MAPTVVLLGPQRWNPTLVSAFDELGLEGPVAAVTAGWQEREAEVEEMREHLGRPVVNLLLHERGERLFAADPAFAALYRERQARLRQLQELYRLRLAPTLKAAREVLARDGDPELLEPERRAALQAVRVLDAHHLKRVSEAHEEFEARAGPLGRPALLRQRNELGKLLRPAVALAIAGGHVALLLNRLRLFGVLDLSGNRPIVAWSAGAMALASRIVLFHDNPPQGAGNAEVLENGLGLFDDLLPLPHAARRLDLDDPLKVSLLARRFAPQVPVALDPGARLSRRGAGAWRPGPGTRRLTPRGEVAAFPGP
jgi:hypothetical protein